MSWTIIIGVGGGLVLLAVVIYGFRQGSKVRGLSLHNGPDHTTGGMPMGDGGHG
jgi:hypothetical protein